MSKPTHYRAENTMLRALLSSREDRVRVLEGALEAWADDFKRDIVSGNFVSEDRHEAMRLTDAALSPAVPVTPERKPCECGGRGYIIKRSNNGGRNPQRWSATCQSCPPPQKPEEGGAR